MNFGHIHFWGAGWFGSQISGGKRWGNSQQKQLKIDHPQMKLHLPTIDFQGLFAVSFREGRCHSVSYEDF